MICEYFVNCMTFSSFCPPNYPVLHSFTITRIPSVIKNRTFKEFLTVSYLTGEFHHFLLFFFFLTHLCQEMNNKKAPSIIYDKTNAA